ncbi:MAG: energy transducer TonB [Bacteroidia bacterium]|nr:energy transducer TonB [Bacteroidia bacterium]
MDLKKNPEADLEKKKTLFKQIGLAVALGAVLLAFEWKSYDSSLMDLGELQVDDTPEEMIPITKPEEKPPPPPPPPAPVLNIVEDDVEIENEIEIEETEVDDDTEIEIIEVFEEEEAIEEPEIFMIVEQMPTFPGGEAALHGYLQKNIKYPPVARENGISGTVYVNFVVTETGSITDIKILRGIGGGCDEEAVRVIRSMPNWKPGKQRGKAVKVSFNCPINFKLR